MNKTKEKEHNFVHEKTVGGDTNTEYIIIYCKKCGVVSYDQRYSSKSCENNYSPKPCLNNKKEAI